MSGIIYYNHMKNINARASALVFQYNPDTLGIEYPSADIPLLSYLPEAVANVTLLSDEQITFETTTTIWIARLNSNIYKNIFPEEPFDMTYILSAMDNAVTTTNDIRQQSHGLSLYDVVYLDTDGKYKKALAEDSKRAVVVGVVAGVPSPNVFTLLTTGLIHYERYYGYDDTSILYLSDKEPGKLVHYQEIQNTIYVPVAVYTNQGIIVHILQGSIGLPMIPYGEDVQTFETYTMNELNELITTVKDGVVDG